MRRLGDVVMTIVLTVLMAYGSYIAAEQLDVSGVLAAVVCGLYLGWRQAEVFDAEIRLTGVAFWRILVFMLETLLFVLLGLQLETVLDQLGRPGAGSLIADGLAVSATVIVVRLLYVLVALPTRTSDWRERLLIGWCGMRGAISLAAVLGLALSVPGRAELIVLTFIVILVTLVGQGLTLPWLIRTLGLTARREWSPDEAIARLEAAQAALDRPTSSNRNAAPTASSSDGCAAFTARGSASAWPWSAVRTPPPPTTTCATCNCATETCGAN